MEEKDNIDPHRIVFMGTPEFAVASLKALVDAGFNVVGVITAPDKAAGRGMKLQESAVKKYAVENGLTLLQPLKLKAPEFIAELKALNADLQVVVAFRMLPEIVWNMPPLGTINVHASLLPNYRGAAPINWAIINGEIETGITTFKLQHAIDTGDVLLQEKLPIGANETAGDLHDKLKILGAEVLVKTVKGLFEKTVQPKPQPNFNATEPSITPDEKSSGKDENLLHHAPKIFTETCHIDATKTIAELHNLVRGLSPYPGAYTLLNGKILKLFLTEKNYTQPYKKIGEFYTDGKHFLQLECADGYLNILELQLEGKRRMGVHEFLRGNKI